MLELHDEVVTDLQEGGEGLLTGDPRPEVIVAIVEPAEDVEDQDMFLHRPAKVAERVCHALHLEAELVDGEVALDERPEARIETQSPGLGVAQKLALECQLGPASVQSVADEVVEVQGDRPQDLGEDDVVVAQPRGSLDHAHSVEGGRRGEELLRVDILLCQGIGRIALVLPSEGGLPQTGLPYHVLRLGSDKGGGESGVGSHRGARRGWWSRERVDASPCTHHQGARCRSPRRHAEGQGRSPGAHDQAASGIRGGVDDGVLHYSVLRAPYACTQLPPCDRVLLQGRATSGRLQGRVG